MKRLFAVILVSLFFMTGCASMDNQSKTYTAEEVAGHNTESDCWMIINDKVYDFTDYIDQHPAGKNSVLSGCGLDATEMFYNVEHTTGDSLKEDYIIGDLAK